MIKAFTSEAHEAARVAARVIRDQAEILNHYRNGLAHYGHVAADDVSCALDLMHEARASLERAAKKLSQEVSPVEYQERTCRVCGCTDTDCRQCIEKTGAPCYWTEPDLCSACEKADSAAADQIESAG